MALFENLEIKKFSSHFFSSLNPVRAPYYFITVACCICLVYDVGHESAFQWYTFSSLIVILLFTVLINSRKSTNVGKVNEFISEIRLSRIMGVAVGIISLALILGNMKQSNLFFIAAISIVLIQVIFCLTIKEPNETNTIDEREFRMINVPQLILISNILLVSMTSLLSEGALRQATYSFYNDPEMMEFEKILKNHEEYFIASQEDIEEWESQELYDEEYKESERVAKMRKSLTKKTNRLEKIEEEYYERKNDLTEFHLNNQTTLDAIRFMIELEKQELIITGGNEMKNAPPKTKHIEDSIKKYASFYPRYAALSLILLVAYFISLVYIKRSSRKLKALSKSNS